MKLRSQQSKHQAPPDNEPGPTPTYNSASNTIMAPSFTLSEAINPSEWSHVKKKHDPATVMHEVTVAPTFLNKAPPAEVRSTRSTSIKADSASLAGGRGRGRGRVGGGGRGRGRGRVIKNSKNLDINDPKIQHDEDEFNGRNQLQSGEVQGFKNRKAHSDESIAARNIDNLTINSYSTTSHENLGACQKLDLDSEEVTLEQDGAGVHADGQKNINDRNDNSEKSKDPVENSADSDDSVGKSGKSNVKLIRYPPKSSQKVGARHKLNLDSDSSPYDQDSEGGNSISNNGSGNESNENREVSEDSDDSVGKSRKSNVKLVRYPPKSSQKAGARHKLNLDSESSKHYNDRNRRDSNGERDSKSKNDDNRKQKNDQININKKNTNKKPKTNNKNTNNEMNNNNKSSQPTLTTLWTTPKKGPKVTKSNKKVQPAVEYSSSNEDSSSSSSDNNATSSDCEILEIDSTDQSDNEEKSDSTDDVELMSPVPESDSDVEEVFTATQDTFLPDFATNEDDTNTIASGTTTRAGMYADENAEVEPESFRYKFHVNLDTNQAKALELEFQKKHKHKEPLDAFSKVRQAVKAFVKEMKIIDQGSMIITWKDGPTFKVIQSVQDIPTGVQEFSRFFQNFKRNQDTGTMYMRIKVHTTRSNAEDFENDLNYWALAENMKFAKLEMQTEHAAAIGYLLFSTGITNSSHLISHLMKHTGYEWATRLTALSSRDKELEWPKRLKVLELMVPHEHAEYAPELVTQAISQAYSLQHTPSFTARYMFIHPESQMPNLASVQNHKKLCAWHKVFNEKITGKISFIIDCDLDKEFDIAYHRSKSISLRKIILSIPCANSNSIFHNDFLFHSVDFHKDLSKTYLKGRRGPDCSGHVFSYFSENEMEAGRMIKGLGIYVDAVFGHLLDFTEENSNEDFIEEMFTDDHWKATKKWAWLTETSEFTTPLEAGMAFNLSEQDNKPFAKMFETLDEAATNEAMDLTAPVSADIVTKKAKQSKSKKIEDRAAKKQAKLMSQMRNQDISEVQADDGGKTTERITDQVAIDDNVSTASSLTDNTGGLDDCSLQSSATMQTNNGSIASLKQVSSVQVDAIKNSSMSKVAKRKAIQALVDHQLKKVVVSSGILVEKLLADFDSDASKAPVTSTSALVSPPPYAPSDRAKVGKSK
jgi:hypothetical protein